jgi:hypothetical protein
LKPCRTFREVASFILLDVDTIGIPADSNGIIRPGVEENRQRMFYFQTGEQDSGTLREIKGKDDEDVTFYIKADWEGNPETMLLDIRYCGRRITTINPDLSTIKEGIPTGQIDPHGTEREPTELNSDQYS